MPWILVSTGIPSVVSWMKNRVAILVLGAANSGVEAMIRALEDAGITSIPTDEIDQYNRDFYPRVHVVERPYQTRYCAIKYKITKNIYKKGLRKLLYDVEPRDEDIVCIGSESLITHTASTIEILLELGYVVKVIKMVEALTLCTTFMVERDGIHRNKAANIYNSAYVAFYHNINAFLDLKRYHLVIQKKDFLEDPSGTIEEVLSTLGVKPSQRV